MDDSFPEYDEVELTVDGFYDPDKDEYVDAFDWEILPDFELCTYCETRLLKVEGEEKVEIEGKDDEFLLRDYCLWYCRNCRFWQSRVYFDPGVGDCMPGPLNYAYISKWREFSSDLPDGCSVELASFIKQHPGFLHSYNPTKFEKLVADIFRANFTDSEVFHVGKPDDGGVDIVMVDSQTKQWLIQVKRRARRNTSEGVATVRNMLGAMIVEGIPRSIIVSNANQFSLRAQQAATRAEEVGLTVRLVDKGILNRMVDAVLPDRPWLSPIRSLDPDLAERLAQEIPSDQQKRLW